MRTALQHDQLVSRGKNEECDMEIYTKDLEYLNLYRIRDSSKDISEENPFEFMEFIITSSSLWHTKIVESYGSH